MVFLPLILQQNSYQAVRIPDFTSTLSVICHCRPSRYDGTNTYWDVKIVNFFWVTTTLYYLSHPDEYIETFDDIFSRTYLTIERAKVILTFQLVYACVETIADIIMLVGIRLKRKYLLLPWIISVSFYILSLFVLTILAWTVLIRQGPWIIAIVWIILSLLSTAIYEVASSVSFFVLLPTDCENVIDKLEEMPFFNQSLDECVKLNLVKRVETISDISVTLTGLSDEYKDVFKGNGHLSYTYDIKISDKAEPKICPARRLPRALLQPVKEELFKMEEDGIIEKIEEPTVWAHPMVVVKKPSGKYRICIDPRELNKWVLREHYTLPAPENILAEIPKAKFYSVLDAKSAFWQVPLSENTSKYLVMSTPFGRYRFLRLPFGISSAPEIFQKIMHKIFCDIPNVVCYIDDLLIWGNSIV
ncbi:K02A2.6-like [Cordylochernes scorpioides]|uniref:K02A2.6-like n=1 Tax=Cordylochernes scorpioides TaxID=51811 RepID=A0ABY6L4P2_9ARAC|nr:K02A2.6-like [Cordylochernes scorpioides]